MDTETLIAQLSADAPPVRPMGSPWALAAKWLVGMSVYGMMAVLFLGLRPDITLQLQTPLFALEIIILVALVASCTISAAVLSFPDMYQARRGAQIPLVFFGLLAALIAYKLSGLTEPMTLAMEECWCTVHLALFAALPAALLFYTLRRAASTQAAATGCVVVLMAFSFGALIVRLVEENDSTAHIVLLHYAPMLAAALIGVALGRKLLRW